MVLLWATAECLAACVLTSPAAVLSRVAVASVVVAVDVEDVEAAEVAAVIVAVVVAVEVVVVVSAPVPTELLLPASPAPR